MQGYLLKQSQGAIKVWKRRFFSFEHKEPFSVADLSHVIKKTSEKDDAMIKTLALATISTSGLLISFSGPVVIDGESQSSARPLDIINVRDIVSVTLSKTNSFAIDITMTSGKVACLAATSDEDIKAWINAIDVASSNAIDISNDARVSKAVDDIQAVKSKQGTLKSDSAIDMQNIDVLESEDVVIESAQNQNEAILSEEEKRNEYDAKKKSVATDETEGAEVAEVPQPKHRKSLVKMISNLGKKISALRNDKSADLDAESGDEVEEPEEPEVEPEPEVVSAEGCYVDGFAIPSNALVYGYVKKQSDHLKKWNRRFVLAMKEDEEVGDGVKMFYYRPNEKDAPAGEMVISKMEKLNISQGYGLKLTPVQAEKSWILSLAKADERDQMLEKLGFVTN